MARHFHVAEFEEKTYENQANLELNWGSLPHRLSWRYRHRSWSPGQVLENLLGFDVAYNPSARRLWRLLTMRRPRGLHLGDIDDAWFAQAITHSPLRLPRSFRASLFLQYKRPEWYDGLPGGRSMIWDGQSYFRFKLNTLDDQHLRLLDLERVVAHDAVVRYAAPAFHTLAELDHASHRGRVIYRSGFLSPSGLNHPHKYWTYQYPGVTGRPNPTDELAQFDSWRQLMEEVDALQDATGLFSHLSRLGEALSSSEELAFTAELSEQFDTWTVAVGDLVGNDLAQALANLARIQTVSARLGVSWHLLADTPSTARRATPRPPMAY